MFAKLFCYLLANDIIGTIRYESIDIVQSIIEHNLDDLRVFAQTVLTAAWTRG